MQTSISELPSRFALDRLVFGAGVVGILLQFAAQRVAHSAAVVRIGAEDDAFVALDPEPAAAPRQTGPNP